MPTKKEESLQIQICNYLRIQYPKVLWACDLSSGLKLTMGQAVKAKRMRQQRGYPDLMIFEPKGKCGGLFLELKRDGTKTHTKLDNLVADEHIREQAHILNLLNSKGYHAQFAIGFKQAKQVIDAYLNSKF